MGTIPSVVKPIEAIALPDGPGPSPIEVSLVTRGVGSAASRFSANVHRESVLHKGFHAPIVDRPDFDRSLETLHLRSPQGCKICPGFSEILADGSQQLTPIPLWILHSKSYGPDLAPRAGRQPEGVDPLDHLGTSRHPILGLTLQWNQQCEVAAAFPG